MISCYPGQQRRNRNARIPLQGDGIIKTLNIAHRGASSIAPENTAAAFDTAIEAGADGIEFDVQMSRDSIAVVIHDENLDRTTSGQGPVRTHTFEELKKLDAGSWFSPVFASERILSLEEIFNRYGDTELLFNIELKNNRVDYPGIEKNVLDCVAGYNLQKRVIVSSFNRESLLACRRLDSQVRTGLIYFENIDQPWDLIRSLGCYSAHPLFSHLQFPEILSGFMKHGVPLYPWTVNDPLEMEKLVSAGVEAIITDYPQVLANVPG